MLLIQTKPAVGKHSTESLRTVFGRSYLFTVCPPPPVALVIIQLCVWVQIQTVVLIIVIWTNVHVQDQKSPLRCLQMCVTPFSHIPTQPLFSELLLARQLPRYPDIKGNTFFSARKGCSKTVLLHCGVSLLVCPSLPARKAFLLEAGLWQDRREGVHWVYHVPLATCLILGTMMTNVNPKQCWFVL